nr:MAG TPA: Minor tail protein [Caudoviricetes sp.]
MAETYSVEAVLTAVDKGMSSTLNGLQKAINGLQKTSSAFDTISNKSSSMFKSMLAANLVSSAIGSAVGSIKGSLGEMVGELNSSKKAWDTFDGNLSKLGWGKDQINQAKEAMQDYATKTIYSASDMASTFSQMAAIGRQDSGQLVEAMGGLAASAENPKQAMKSLSQQMVQALAKPKITWQDFRIMMEQAPAGMSAVAKEMGLSLNELITKIQDGQVKTEDFAEAFKRAGMSMQDMATSYKTIDQALDGLKETLANKLKPAFDALSKAGIKALEAIMNQLDKIDFNKLATSLEEVLNKIDFNAIVEKIASFVSTSVAKIKEFWQGFSDSGAISNFKVTLNEIWQAIKKVVSALAGGDFESFGQKLGRGLNIASGALQAFAKVVESLSPAQIRGIAEAFIAFKTTKALIGPTTTALNGLSKAVVLTKSGIAGLRTIKDVGMALIGISKGSKAAYFGLKFMAEGSKLARIGLGGLNILTKIGGWITPAISAIGTFISGIMEGSAIAGAFSSAWGAIVAVISGPVGWIIGIVVALVAAFTLLWNKCEGFRNFFIGLWNGIVNVASNAWKKIQSAWSGLIEWFTNLWNSIKETASNAWNNFLEGARPIVEAFMNVWNALKDFFSALWGGIVSVATTVWNSIVEVVTPIIEAIKTAWNSITEVATTAWNTLQPVVEAVWTAIQQFITSAIQVIQNVITTGMQIVQNVWNAVWTVFTTIVQTVWTVISTVISTVLNVIAGIINTVTSIIKGDWRGAWENIKGVAQTVWEGIKSVISTVINAISNIISTVLSTIKNIVTTIWNGIKDFISNAINNIKNTVINVANSLKDGFLNVMGSLKSGVSNAIDAVKGFFNRLWNIDLSGAGRAIMDGFLGGLKSAWSAVTDFVGGIASWIAEHKGPISYDRRLLIPAGQAIMGGFNTALMVGFEDVKSNVSGMADGIRSMFDDAGSRVSAMSNALQGDFSNNVSGTLSATYEVSQTKEPAIINLALGSNDFRAFVSDISNIQSKEERIRLKAQSL